MFSNFTVMLQTDGQTTAVENTTSLAEVTKQLTPVHGCKVSHQCVGSMFKVQNSRNPKINNYIDTNIKFEQSQAEGLWL